MCYVESLIVRVFGMYMYSTFVFVHVLYNSYYGKLFLLSVSEIT